MKKILLFIVLLYLVSSFESYADSPTYTYDPIQVEWSANYNDVILFRAIVYDKEPNWKLRIVELTNANLYYNNQVIGGGVNDEYFGPDVMFYLKLTTPGVQAVLKVEWICNNISRTNRIWKINVGAVPTVPSIGISGPNEIKGWNTATYTADYSSHTSSTNYTWSSTAGKLSIVSGQGTKTVTVKANANTGTDQLKVLAGGISALKSISITSDTTFLSNQTITTNKDYSNRVVMISNTTITNNATVNITAENAIIIKPNFLAQTGTKVVIKATGSALRSSTFEEESEENLEIPVIQTSATLINDVDNSLPIRFIQVYSLTGNLVYSSTVNFDLQSLNLRDGVYIVQKTDAGGNVSREKVILKR